MSRDLKPNVSNGWLAALVCVLALAAALPTAAQSGGGANGGPASSLPSPVLTHDADRGRVNVTSQLGVEPTLSVNWVDLPQGQFTTTVVGQRAIFTMTPRMFVAALVQYQSSNASLSTNLRLRWEYHPGSELFVVYTEGRSTLPPSGTDLQSRGFAVKINRLFRF